MKTFLTFVFGAAIGAAGSWFYFQKKYFGPINEPEEDENVDNDESASENDIVSDEDSDQEATDESDRIAYHKAVEQYTNDEEDKPKGPYIITEEEFDDSAMELAVAYSYFEDGVILDDEDNIVEDANEAIGEEFVNHFDDHNRCYVRNEARHCDYEIIKEGSTYFEPPKEE